MSVKISLNLNQVISLMEMILQIIYLDKVEIITNI
jgi:hypothetical protein